MDKNYNNYSKLQYGKVYEFDGEAGIIITDEGEYVFDKKDIRDNSYLEKGDVVIFRINHLPFGNEVIELAKFIKKEDNKPKRNI
jgi:hypothetical protein